jgi:hypothetical protein
MRISILAISWLAAARIYRAVQSAGHAKFRQNYRSPVRGGQARMAKRSPFPAPMTA